MSRDYTWRDAGLHSAPLKGLNRVGRRLARLRGRPLPALTPEAVVAAARKSAGLYDLGAPTWEEPLQVLCEALEREAQLSTFGRIAMKGMLSGALANRLKVRDWASRHPEVREERIERPWVIVGLPRTGTSLLSLLLGLDPLARPLQSWEAACPVPPPELATHAEDPRIAAAQAGFARLEQLNPPLKAFHPFGATLATECVTLLILDLRSLSIDTQAYLPSYGRWLEACDMSSAYDWHRLSLQILQSRLPTESWVLKTPNHLWCLPTLLDYYPDARIIWTHRDPAKVVPSVASLNTAMQRANSERSDPLAVAADWDHRLHLAVTRGMAFDADRGGDWCCHLQYADLMADPVGAVRRIYAHFGDLLLPLHERRMETWMRERHQTVFGRHVYDPADFGMSEEGIRDRYADYRERFQIPDER